MEDTALMGYFHFIRYLHTATSPKFRFIFELFSLIVISLFISTLFVMHNQFVGKSNCLNNLPNNTRFDILSIEIKGDHSVFSRQHIYTKTHYEIDHHTHEYLKKLKGAIAINFKTREEFYQNIGTDLKRRNIADEDVGDEDHEPCILDDDSGNIKSVEDNKEKEEGATKKIIVKELKEEFLTFEYLLNIMHSFVKSFGDNKKDYLKVENERLEKEHMKRLREEIRKHIKDIDKNQEKFQQLIKSYDEEFEYLKQHKRDVENIYREWEQSERYQNNLKDINGGYLYDLKDVVQYFIDSHNPRYEFSFQNTLLMLTNEQRNRFNITTLHIDINSNDQCLGNKFHKTIIGMLGYDILMINNLVNGIFSKNNNYNNNYNNNNYHLYHNHHHKKSNNYGYLRIAGDSQLINLHQYVSPNFSFTNESILYILYRFFETNLLFFSTLIVFGSSLKLCESSFAHYIDRDPRGVLKCMLHNLLIASLFIFIQIGFVSLFSIILPTEYLVFFICSLVTSYFSTWGLRSKESIKYYPIIFLSILYALILYIVFFPAGFHPIAFYVCYALSEYLLIICLFNFEIPAVLNNRIIVSSNNNNNNNVPTLPAPPIQQESNINNSRLVGIQTQVTTTTTTIVENNNG